MSADSVHASWNVSAFNTGLVFRVADLGCRLLPRAAVQAISDSLMDWYQGLRPEVPAAIADNLRLAFPGRPERDIEDLVARTFRTYGRGVVDYLRASHDPPRVQPEDGAARRLLAVPGGKVLVTAHMGNWEVGGHYLGRVVGRHWIVGFPESDPGVEAFRAARRAGSGHTTLVARQDLGTMFRLRAALEAGESVVVLVDRAVGSDRIEVRFRGRPSFFLKSPALLASLARVPLVPVAVMAEGSGAYVALVGEPATPPPGTHPSALMQGPADFFSKVLERYPDQWYNFFRYWQEGP